MRKKYRVRLSQTQREELQRLTRSGTIKVRKCKRVRELLLVDEAHKNGCKTDGQIAELVDASVATIQRVRRRLVEEGLEATITEKPRPGKPRTFRGQQRARITALACSDPPEGYGRFCLLAKLNRTGEVSCVTRN